MSIHFYYIKDKKQIHKVYSHVSNIANELWEILLDQHKNNIILHREDGPAVLEIDEDGNSILEWYYLYGKFIHKDDWNAIYNSKCESDLIESLLSDREEIREAARLKLNKLLKGK